MDQPSPTPDDPDAMANPHRDWMTIWQSELAGMAVDRELAEQWLEMASLWTRAFAGMLPARDAADADRGGRDGGGSAADAAPRAAPADAAPDARDAEIDRLRKRVAVLEQRLAAPAPAPKPKRRKGG